MKGKYTEKPLKTSNLPDKILKAMSLANKKWTTKQVKNK